MYQLNRLAGVSLLSIAIGLTGCGGGGSDSPAAQHKTPASTTVSGVASKGPINGGTATAFALNADGSKGAELASAPTNSDGSFTLDLGDYTGNVIVEVTGGSYIDEASGASVVNTKLRVALSGVSGSTTANATAMTELAVQVAETKSGGLSSSNITSANTQISNLTGVDIVTTAPADVLASDASTLSSEAQAYGVALAGISQMLADGSASSIDDAISQLASDIEDNDQLDSIGAAYASAITTFVGSDSNQTADSSSTGLVSLVNSSTMAPVSTELYAIDLNGKTAVSVITTNFCTDGTEGGWTYTFTSTGVTMTGSDSFVSDGMGNCTLGASESFSLTDAELADFEDIPFNCGGDHVCVFSDLNKVITGVDGDGRDFTSVYTHIPGSSSVTYVKSASDGTVFTEVITLLSGEEVGSALACDTTGAPYSYEDFLSVVSSCGPQSIAVADISGKTLAYQAFAGEQLDFNADGSGIFTNDGGIDYSFTWSIDSNGYLNLEYDFGYPVKEQYVAYMGDLTDGLSIKAYGEGETLAGGLVGDRVFDSVTDGEIYDDVLVEVVSGL